MFALRLSLRTLSVVLVLTSWASAQQSIEDMQPGGARSLRQVNVDSPSAPRLWLEQKHWQFAGPTAFANRGLTSRGSRRPCRS